MIAGAIAPHHGDFWLMTVARNSPDPYVKVPLQILQGVVSSTQGKRIASFRSAESAKLQLWFIKYGTQEQR
jgi:hypothetical protein